MAKANPAINNEKTNSTPAKTDKSAVKRPKTTKVSETMKRIDN